MSQNLRVALWVPQADPAAVGNSIRTTNLPSANHRIQSEFAAGGGVPFADDSEVTAGLISNESISPLTLRNEMAREFNIPATVFTSGSSGAVAIQVSAGPASANFLVKTSASGLLDDSLLPMDGGTF